MKTIKFISVTVFLLITFLSNAQQNVGIGTQNPKMKLHISEADSTVLLLENSQALQDKTSNGLYFKTGPGPISYTGALKTIGESNSSARLGLFTFSSSSTTGLKERLSISDVGTVGIGTTSPLRDLHVSAPRQELLLLENSLDLSDGATSAMIFKTGNGTRSYTGAIKTIGKSVSEARLGLFTSAAVTSQGLQERLSILDNGDVGIGTTSPASKLHVAEQSNKLLTLQNEVPLNEESSSDIEFKIGSGSLNYHAGAIKVIGASLHSARMGFFTFASVFEGNLQERMSISDQGYVGIGSTEPLSNLHISGDNENLMILENQNPLSIGATSAMFFRSGTVGTSYTGAIKTIGSTSASARLGFFTYAANDKASLLERLSIADNGFVGINTTSPSANLHVQGGFKLQDGSQGDGKVLTSNATGETSWETPNVCSLSIGDSHAGGIIFYVDGSGCHGLVAKVNDELLDLKWATTLGSTDAVGQEIYAGEHNTNKIISRRGAGTSPAADICSGLTNSGNSDWYLPSRIELDMMFVNLKENSLGNFTNNWYWSSSESNALSAWTQNFANGNQDGVFPNNKLVEHSVRAIRKF